MTDVPPDGRLRQALQQARRFATQGRIADADRLYRRITSTWPGAAEAWHDWGCLAAATGHHETAITLLRQATALQADAPAYRFTLGQTLSRSGDTTAAESELRHVVRLAPENPAGWNELGTLLKRDGRREEAIDCFRQALRIAPDFVAARFNLALTLFDEGRHAAAEAACRRALEQAPGDAGIVSALGAILHAQGRFDEATRHLEEAVRLAPNDAASHHNLGESLREQGRLDDAVEAYRRGLAVAPADTVIWHSLAMTRRFESPDDPEIAAMRSLYDGTDVDDVGRRRLAFALAKAYDDCDREELAWPCYATANRLARAACDYSIEHEAERIEAIIDCFDPAFFDERRDWGLADPRTTPVFIVGMPRSGTSLVEQILASHSRVDARGEIQDLRLALRETIGPVDDMAYLDALRRLDKTAVRRIARTYLERLRKQGGLAPYTTNKLPFNFLHIGVIRLLFPRAKVVHCRRHPVATCFSIFQHDFTNMGGFAYDLRELGRYYRLYERLMAHWQDCLPGFVETIEYESLVADQEAWSRRLVGYCGLDWEPACLEFHRARRSVNTASFTQVRRPIYRRAIAHWRRYEAHLTPLLESLSEASGDAPSPLT